MADITITASDGGNFNAYLSKPEKTPAPGVVILQEVYGVNRFIKRISDYWASQGFLVASPDVYWRPRVTARSRAAGDRSLTWTRRSMT